MILPVFVAGILMLGILAATGNAQESSNTGNRQHTFLPETEENNAHFAQESNNHPMCLNEHTEIWEPCVVKNSSQKQESSNTPSSQESSKTGKEVKESSNTGKEVKESSNNGQSSVPVRAPITITPMRAHITNTKTHMTTTNNEQLANNGMLTGEQKQSTVEEQRRAALCSLASAKGLRTCELLEQEKLATEKNCRQTAGGSFLCPPKFTVERAPHTGNLYEMRAAAAAAAEKKLKEKIWTAAELGPGWREVPRGGHCILPPGVPFHEISKRMPSGQNFCKDVKAAPQAPATLTPQLKYPKF